MEMKETIKLLAGFGLGFGAVVYGQKAIEKAKEFANIREASAMQKVLNYQREGLKRMKRDDLIEFAEMVSPGTDLSDMTRAELISVVLHEYKSEYEQEPAEVKDIARKLPNRYNKMKKQDAIDAIKDVGEAVVDGTTEAVSTVIPIKTEEEKEEDEVIAQTAMKDLDVIPQAYGGIPIVYPVNTIETHKVLPAVTWDGGTPFMDHQEWEGRIRQADAENTKIDKIMKSVVEGYKNLGITIDDKQYNEMKDDIKDIFRDDDNDDKIGSIIEFIEDDLHSYTGYLIDSLNADFHKIMGEQTYLERKYGKEIELNSQGDNQEWEGRMYQADATMSGDIVGFAGSSARSTCDVCGKYCANGEMIKNYNNTAEGCVCDECLDIKRGEGLIRGNQWAGLKVGAYDKEMNINAVRTMKKLGGKIGGKLAKRADDDEFQEKIATKVDTKVGEYVDEKTIKLDFMDTIRKKMRGE